MQLTSNTHNRYFLNELASLISEGYTVLFTAHTLGGGEFAKLRHSANGNVMEVNFKRAWLTLKKNNIIIKRYETKMY